MCGYLMDYYKIQRLIFEQQIVGPENLGSDKHSLSPTIDKQNNLVYEITKISLN